MCLQKHIFHFTPVKANQQQSVFIILGTCVDVFLWYVVVPFEKDLRLLVTTSNNTEAELCVKL